MMNQESLVVLDATLRDGGYLNNWQFEPYHADNAIRAASRTGADFIEVGYLDDACGLAETAGCAPAVLERFQALNGQSRLAVMMRPDCAGMEKALDRRRDLFDLVRIPTSLSNPEVTILPARRCRDRGFIVSANLTNITAFTSEAITAAVAALANDVDIIYLADSRGALQPEQVAGKVSAVRNSWDGPLGFHAHDNLGLAVANSRVAIETGCNWIDGTLCGVGMGGRNLNLLDALELAGRELPDSAGSFHEKDFGLSPPGEEVLLYHMSAERNLPMAWPEFLLERFGAKTALLRLACVPARNWMDLMEIEPWLAEDIETTRVIRRRVYESQGLDHETADHVFYTYVKHVHERHGAVFLSRRRDASGRVTVEWLYASVAEMAQIQNAVAKDAETIANRTLRLESGLHACAFDEQVLQAAEILA